MEAPEKLYVDTEDNLTDSILYGFTEKRKEDDIEYTRTDTFIEKALAWIEEHGEFIETEDNSTTRQIPDYFVENFKKYMEEE